MDIYVTGYSMVSAMGFNNSESLEKFSAYTSGIKEQDFKGINQCKLGAIQFSNRELKDTYGIKGDYSRTAILGVAGVKEAITMPNNYPVEGIRTGLISGTSVGGMDYTEDKYFSFLNKNEYDSGNYTNHPNGTVTCQIAAELQGIDYIDTVSTACSSAANAILQGARLIRQGILDRAIVGGTDSLSQFTIHGFRSLMIYDSEFCKPFDDNRKGLNLGEGSGYLILESERAIDRTKNKPIAKITGWCNASDAFHQTASSPEGIGAVITMKGALKMAGVRPNEISYINAHGTATENNDLSESVAIKTVFGDQPPPFSSTKSFTGHTLAASGGIESAFSIMSIEKGILFPNLNHDTPIDGVQLIPNIKYVDGLDIQHVLTNSFGFGGNNTTLIYSSL